jgi:hypothetical protein
METIIVKDPWGRTQARTEIPLPNSRILRIATGKEIPGIGNGALQSTADELLKLPNGDEVWSSGNWTKTLVRSQDRATAKNIKAQHAAALEKLATMRPELFTN